MKNTNLLEKIGFAMIIIGFIFMLVDGVWKSNPIPNITDKNMLLHSLGLGVWAIGYMISQNKEKEKTN